MDTSTIGDYVPRDEPSSAAAKASVDNGKTVGRKNTAVEKKRMRNLRIKRKRKLQAALRKKETEKLKNKLKLEHQKQMASEHKIRVLKCMARTYWERWHWELEKRKETLREYKRGRNGSLQVPGSTLHEIDPSMLHESIVEGKEKEHFIGRGSFSIVKVQYYRGVLVAVKRFLVHS